MLTVAAFAFAPAARVSSLALASSSRGVRSSAPNMGLLDGLMGKSGFDGPVVMGTEEMMSQKQYGTSAVPIQTDLRWNCDVKTADNICNYNRHYAEYGGYWERVMGPNHLKPLPQT